ncbi:Glutathione transport system permease protein gsiC [Urinicoccus massiliensis]|uniref:Glutathione transport system permease protein gsiC n=1 Tax=Urinicoccus massiliensis TaxID=1723382 RepID=A0A8H2M6B0_9FIRM|nr:ABC transporter permease [Urinicoccus massiliensis]KGF11338.1 peptide ABC transporter permease [Tissierellia bacterium S5-A11]VFB15651.1 Glutathione transport system permease protein gsiC [Urinicoccus massiliensis]
MLKYIFKRILSLIPTLIGVSFIVFTLLYFTPGDAVTATMGATAPKEAMEAARESLGLNDPFFIQYGRFLKNALLHFDLGKSYITGNSVTDTLAQVFPNTLKLAFFSLSIALFFGIGLGIFSAVKKYSVWDQISMVFGLIGLAMPIFWSGLLLILLFSVRWGLLPSSGFMGFKYMILPGMALGLQSTAVILRQTRSSMLDVLDQDYIRTARAKGVKESRVIIIHALRNALVPVITSIGLQMGSLLGGSVLTETIFSIPGIGRIMVESIKTRDYPLILGGVLFIALAYCLISLLVDILYSVVDPKIRSKSR